ncbi:MAG: ribosome biogenesis GTP-binding protein YihA/YsxC [Xanthobacteraceae bacterium]
MTVQFTAAEIEAARRLFAGDWQFVHAAPSVDALPAMAGFEVAVSGRSNVGKSSLINALTGRRALARTSHTPGRTQELIFFSLDRRITLVDMPGYGYAEAPRDKVAAWTELIHAYLSTRANLARVYVLIDARHGLKETDTPVLDELGRAAVSYQIVLTKADQVKADELRARIAATAAAIGRRAAAFPDIIATSSRTGEGIPELRAAIGRLAAERDR